MTITSDDFRAYVREVLATPKPPLPAAVSSLGPVTAEWFEVADEPGTAIIITTGGSAADRYFSEVYLREQLRQHGYRQATLDLENEPFRKTANWSDIMAKAKRLIQAGQVTIGNNSWGSVVGHVIGDHGEYNCELSREDPDSGVITQWQCECPWAQYAWGRTRQWKKYEGRVCAHALALYWKAKSTPLDGGHPSGETPPGQMGPAAPGGGGQMGLPGVNVAPGTPSPGPGGPGGPSPTPAAPQSQQGQLFPPDAGGAMPASPGVIPSFPGDQMALFENWAGPGTTPGGGQSPPWAVSVPGAKQPSPFNPIQNPNTLSKVAAEQFNPGDRVLLLADEYGVREGREGAYDDGEWTTVPKGTPGQVFDFDPTTGLMSVLFELHGGPMSSYRVRCYLDRSNVRPAKGRSPLDPGQTPSRPLL